DVGGQADADAPRRGESKHASRNLSRRTDRVLEGDTKRMEVADGLDHRQRAAGESARGPARNTVADLDVEVSKAIAAVFDTGTGDGIGDERESSLRSLPDHRRGHRRDVYPVQDQLHDDIRTGEGRSDDTRIAVMER